MRYIKVFVLVSAFFLTMVFFFQNQVVLSNQLTLQLDLLFTEPKSSIPLPYYFLLLTSFFVGAVLTLLALIWDKLNLSAKLMKSSWRIRSLEKQVATLQASIDKKQAISELSAPINKATPLDETKV